MSENELRSILQAHPVAQLEEIPAPHFEVQIANGSIVPVQNQVLLRFVIGRKSFEETFLILPTMRNSLIGMSFFKKYSVYHGPHKQHPKIPRGYTSTLTSKWEIRITNVGAQGIPSANSWVEALKSRAPLPLKTASTNFSKT